tara:strand:- start:257 stop:2188 length:1932 start_codon:yes stop_codon:yes gene_type:complete
LFLEFIVELIPSLSSDNFSPRQLRLTEAYLASAKGRESFASLLLQKRTASVVQKWGAMIVPAAICGEQHSTVLLGQSLSPPTSEAHDNMCNAEKGLFLQSMSRSDEYYLAHLSYSSPAPSNFFYRSRNDFVSDSGGASSAILEMVVGGKYYIDKRYLSVPYPGLIPVHDIEKLNCSRLGGAKDYGGVVQNEIRKQEEEEMVEKMWQKVIKRLRNVSEKLSSSSPSPSSNRTSRECSETRFQSFRQYMSSCNQSQLTHERNIITLLTRIMPDNINTFDELFRLQVFALLAGHVAVFVWLNESRVQRKKAYVGDGKEEVERDLGMGRLIPFLNSAVVPNVATRELSTANMRQYFISSALIGGVHAVEYLLCTRIEDSIDQADPLHLSHLPCLISRSWSDVKVFIPAAAVSSASLPASLSLLISSSVCVQFEHPLFFTILSTIYSKGRADVLQVLSKYEKLNVAPPNQAIFLFGIAATQGHLCILDWLWERYGGFCWDDVLEKGTEHPHALSTSTLRWIYDHGAAQCRTIVELMINRGYLKKEGVKRVCGERGCDDGSLIDYLDPRARASRERERVRRNVESGGSQVGKDRVDAAEEGEIEDLAKVPVSFQVFEEVMRTQWWDWTKRTVPKWVPWEYRFGGRDGYY